MEISKIKTRVCESLATEILQESGFHIFSAQPSSLRIYLDHIHKKLKHPANFTTLRHAPALTAIHEKSGEGFLIAIYHIHDLNWLNLIDETTKMKQFWPHTHLLVFSDIAPYIFYGSIDGLRTNQRLTPLNNKNTPWIDENIAQKYRDIVQTTFLPAKTQEELATHRLSLIQNTGQLIRDVKQIQDEEKEINMGTTIKIYMKWSWFAAGIAISGLFFAILFAITT